MCQTSGARKVGDIGHDLHLRPIANGVGNQLIHREADCVWEHLFYCQLCVGCDTYSLEAFSTLRFGVLPHPSSTFHQLKPPIPLSWIQRAASDRGVFLPVDRDRPSQATVELSGSYHLFVNRDPDVVHSSSDREKNLNRRSIPLLVVTVNSL